MQKKVNKNGVRGSNVYELFYYSSFMNNILLEIQEFPLSIFFAG